MNVQRYARWVFVSLLALMFAVSAASAQVAPPSVEAELNPGGAVGTAKTVQTPEFPPALDLCLLMDLSGSFAGDLSTIKAGNVHEDIFDFVRAAIPSSRFCIASHVDFPLAPFGNPAFNDYPYTLDQPLTDDRTTFVNAFAALGTRDGADFPESQYEALYQMATGEGLVTGDPALDIAPGQNPAWSLDPAVTRVIAEWTDAAFHTPADAGYPSPHGAAEVTTALTAGPFAPIRVVGLKQPGAGGELDALALATGGSTVEGVDAAEIADAIVEGIGNLPLDVTPVPMGCDPLLVGFVPAVDHVTSGDPAHFNETVAVPNDPTLQGEVIMCSVDFVASTGESLGIQEITITIRDITPPQAACLEGPNPAGNVPPAGQKSPGMNEDGFYSLFASDNVDDDPEIFVVDNGSGTVFGPFSNGTNIKYTQAPGATPSQKPGSGDVDWKIKGTGDFYVYAVDDWGNVSDRSVCLVPPPPK